MIVAVALKEFYSNLISFRFVLGFLLCLILIPFAMVVSISDYTSRARAYEMDMKQAGENNKPRVYSALRPQLVRPPEPLSVFSGGIANQTGSSVKIFIGEKPMLAGGRNSTRENPLMNAFFSLDFTSILVVIVTLLAFLFTYDACSGERENGTLKLVFTSGMSRSAFLLGKALGAALTLLPVVLFCYLLSAIIIAVNPHISLGPGEWARVGIMFGMSVLLFLLFAAMGILVSARMRSSVTSIIVCLVLWVTFVFIIPNTAIYLAQSFVTTDTEDNLRLAFGDLDREFENKYTDFRNGLPRPDWMMDWNMNSMGDGEIELAGCSRSMHEYHRQQNVFSEPLRIEYAEKKWALQQAYMNKLDRQRLLAEHLALISPSEVFQQAVSALSRTDVPAYYRFMEQTRRYREILIGYFRERKIFESFQYFTREDPAKMMTADEIVRIRTGGRFQTLHEYSSWASEHNGDFSPLRKADIPGTNPWTYPPLDQSDVPKFKWEPSSLAGDLMRSFGYISGLALGCILLLALSFISFSRYDAR